MSNIDFDINPYFSLAGIDQSQRFRTYCKVVVNGIDVTDRLNPYLISVFVKDGPEWEAAIELDDRNAALPIPPFQASLVIYLGWTSESSYSVFTGVISDVEHGFGRKLGGRRMTIHGFGYKQGSAIKTPFQDHVGEGAPPGQMQGTMIPFAQAASQFAGNAGFIVSVGPTFAGTMRDYWSMNNESAMQWITRHADELGAMSRIEGNNIVFNGIADFGKPNVTAVVGDNVISWRIKPILIRSMWSGGLQDYFDHMLGQWSQITNQFGFNAPFGEGGAIYKPTVPAPNSSVASQTAQGAEQKGLMNSGSGRIMINGEPRAGWGGTVTLIGARPGIDGAYHIMTSDHSWSRQGYVTTLEVTPDTSGSISAGYTTTPSPPNPTPNNPVSVNNPDGSVTTYFSDGTVTVKNALGTTTIHPDGSEDFTPS